MVGYGKKPLVRLRTMDGSIPVNAMALLVPRRRRHCRSEDAAHFAEGTRNAGIPVPARTAAEAALQAELTRAEGRCLYVTYTMLQARTLRRC